MYSTDIYIYIIYVIYPLVSRKRKFQEHCQKTRTLITEEEAMYKYRFEDGNIYEKLNKHLRRNVTQIDFKLQGF